MRHGKEENGQQKRKMALMFATICEARFFLYMGTFVRTSNESSRDEFAEYR